MKKVLMFIVMCAISMVIAQSAQAAGIGVYGTGGVAMMNWQYNGTKVGSSTDYFYGGGLAVDSNVARNELFGYRFTAGYEQYVLTDPGSDAKSDPIHRFSMTHTFGFGVARTEMVRFWIGPKIGLHYLYKHDNGYSYDAIGADALLALGLNVNAGKVFTFFFDIGVGYMGVYNLKGSGVGNSFGADAKLGFMFRINDSYKG
ncbi:MAG TPA: hypothetical protein PLM53_08630 [Spirochaetota bacterium]|nr:hypothetical protein [Spirochaetota bacterium]HPC42195.1 hypothetical protein [Spirochaetota bacterium]HPL16597.1 hypothetical protein [Spirochaetota bacterium]HQF08235.1 hypothetical protein [Spirochaetota bacterium]HQH97150.1 hypothetical protein [Spirochaetota bacterium]